MDQKKKSNNIYSMIQEGKKISNKRKNISRRKGKNRGEKMSSRFCHVGKVCVSHGIIKLSSSGAGFQTGINSPLIVKPRWPYKLQTKTVGHPRS